jgi:hypothetical protein
MHIPFFSRSSFDRLSKRACFAIFMHVNRTYLLVFLLHLRAGACKRPFAGPGSGWKHRQAYNAQPLARAASRAEAGASSAPPPARASPHHRKKEQDIENTKPKRKRGGQPGNTNALKHGFYSHRFRNIELSDLDSALSDGLVDEIALLRVIIRRVFEYADTGDQDLDAWTRTLNTLGAASTRLAGLIRTQQVITGNGGDVVDVLSQAIGEVAHDLGLSDPASN